MRQWEGSDYSALGPFQLPRDLLKIVADYVDDYMTAAYTMLDTQYRMKKHLGEMISKVFYGGSLKSFDTSSDCAVERLRCEGEVMLDNTSTNNPEEAKMVYELWKKYQGSGEEEKGTNSIVVICMYEAQRKLVEKQDPTGTLRAFNVDSFQGQEADIVILTLANNKPTGFLLDPHRINVACSRAKKMLHIVGNENVFRAHPSVPSSWEQIGQYIRSSRPHVLVDKKKATANKNLEIRQRVTQLKSQQELIDYAASNQKEAKESETLSLEAKWELHEEAIIKLLTRYLNTLGSLGDVRRSAFVLASLSPALQNVITRSDLRPALFDALHLGSHKHKQFSKKNHEEMMEYIVAQANWDKDAMRALFSRAPEAKDRSSRESKGQLTGVSPEDMIEPAGFDRNFFDLCIKSFEDHQKPPPPQELGPEEKIVHLMGVDPDKTAMDLFQYFKKTVWKLSRVRTRVNDQRARTPDAYLTFLKPKHARDFLARNPKCREIQRTRDSIHSKMADKEIVGLLDDPSKRASVRGFLKVGRWLSRSEDSPGYVNRIPYGMEEEVKNNNQDLLECIWNTSAVVSLSLDFASRKGNFKMELNKETYRFSFRTDDVMSHVLSFASDKDGPSVRSKRIYVLTLAFPPKFEKQGIKETDLEVMVGWERVCPSDFGADPSIFSRCTVFSLCAEAGNDREVANFKDMDTLLDNQKILGLVKSLHVIQSQEIPDVISRQELWDNVSFKIRYICEYLLSVGILHEDLLEDEIFTLLESSSPSLEHALKNGLAVYSRFQPPPDPVKLLRYYLTKSEIKGAASKFSIREELLRDYVQKGGDRLREFHDLIEVRRIMITPTSVLCILPQFESRNRVLRIFEGYEDCFVRISITDENGEKLSNHAITPIMEERFKSFMANGVTVAGRTFKFLGGSNSQTRKAAWWGMSDFLDHSQSPIDASMVRAHIGTVKDNTLAKNYARYGQAFSSTRQSIRLEKHEWTIEDDVVRNGANFSDGVGRISYPTAKLVAKKLGLDHVPGAFPIRFAGFRGVLAVVSHPDFFDPKCDEFHVHKHVHVEREEKGQTISQCPCRDCKLPEPDGLYKVVFRPSMYKMDSSHNELEICVFVDVIRGYLHRQLIVVLNAAGVDEKVFLEAQKRNLDRLVDLAQGDRQSALETAKLFGNQFRDLEYMVEAGFEFKRSSLPAEPDNREPFLTAMLDSLVRLQVSDLRNKASIHIPKARQALGVLDEFHNIGKGCVIFLFSEQKGTQKFRKFLDGAVWISKSPLLHPGDAQVFRAVVPPEDYIHLYAHQQDVVIFSSQDDRPAADQMSGGDLDGDSFLCIWDPDFTKAGFDHLTGELLVTPPDVDIHVKGTPPRLDRNKNYEPQVHDFLLAHMRTDTLGAIDTAWLAIANLPQHVPRQKARLDRLVELHKIQVDAAKTGVPANPTFAETEVREYPKFMARYGKPVAPTCDSVLQKLSDSLENWQQLNPKAGKDPANRVSDVGYDDDLKIEGFMKWEQQMRIMYKAYAGEIREILQAHLISTEVELLSGAFVISNKGDAHSRMDRQERITAWAASVKNRYQDMLKDIIQAEVQVQIEELEGQHKPATEVQRARAIILKDTREQIASACYFVTYHPKYHAKDRQNKSRPRILSFPWLLAKCLCTIKGRKPRSVAPFVPCNRSPIIPITKNDKFFGNKIDTDMPEVWYGKEICYWPA